jgi:GNAT superfamily N-acetyltransferase
MIRKLDIEEAKKLYRDYIDEDFPNDERPNYNHYVKLLESEEFIPYSYEEENKMKAYIICIEKGDNVLISHLAVLKEYRGQGIGTKSLNEMKFFFKDKQSVILEAEEQAENKKALEIIKRRQKFYKKCGFTSYPNLDYELSGVKYLIFAYSNLENKIEDGKLIEIIKELYKEILSNEKSLVIKLK